MTDIEKNFFFVNRALLESDRWLEDPFSRAQAWIDLIGLARHKDGFAMIRGIKIDLKRGQLCRSQVTLAKRWKWSRGRVKRYLDALQMRNDIELKSVQQTVQQTVQENKYLTTLITVINYNKWQGDGTTGDTADGTANGQQTDSRRYINNKGNKGNKGKNVGGAQISFRNGRRRKKYIAPPSPESLPGYIKPDKQKQS